MTSFSLIRLGGGCGRWQLSLQREINVAMHFMQKSNYIEDALIKHHKLDGAINWSTCCHFRKSESLHLRRNCEISCAPCINLSRILLPHPSLIKQESVSALNKSRRGPTPLISPACSLSVSSRRTGSSRSVFRWWGLGQKWEINTLTWFPARLGDRVSHPVTVNEWICADQGESECSESHRETGRRKKTGGKIKEISVP